MNLALCVLYAWVLLAKNLPEAGRAQQRRIRDNLLKPGNGDDRVIFWLYVL